MACVELQVNSDTLKIKGITLCLISMLFELLIKVINKYLGL